jgi:hypothetical protein
MTTARQFFIPLGDGENPVKSLALHCVPSLPNYIGLVFGTTTI